MYNAGDLIMYGGEGVCRVEGVGVPDIPYIDGERLYYTLRPLYRDGVVYTPVDTDIFMRPVISREEAHELIDKAPHIAPRPCEEKNLRLLSEHYEGIIRTHDCTGLVGLIRAVRSKGAAAEKSKKKLGQVDSRYMNRAQELLHGELAVALGIPRDDVEDYVSERIARAAHPVFEGRADAQEPSLLRRTC